MVIDAFYSIHYDSHDTDVSIHMDKRICIFNEGVGSSVSLVNNTFSRS